MLIPVTSSKADQEFIIETISKHERSTLRLFTEGNLAKPDFVKSAMELITKSILKTFANIRIFSTNMGNFISKRIVDKGDS